MNILKMIIRAGVCFGMLAAGLESALASSAEIHDKSDAIMFPQDVVEGVLPNGLRYLLFPNRIPAHTAEFRLVMKVGSVLENDNQRGVAHFLEHMAFNGTEHFPGRSLINYFERKGMKYGRDINAATGYDRTVYMLTVPMNETDHALADTTLMVLKDWLTGIRFDEANVRKERGVILEELRGYDFGDDFYKLKIGQNRYAERAPLGSAMQIRSVDCRTLSAFYNKWYHPGMACIIVAGCMDAHRMEKRIKTLFADIPPGDLKDYKEYPLSYEPGIQIDEKSDSLYHTSRLEVLIPHSFTAASDLHAYYAKSLEELLIAILRKRCTMRGMNVTVSDGFYLSRTGHLAFGLSATDKKGLLQLLARLSAELQDMSVNGFCTPEISASISPFLENMFLSATDRPSSAVAEELTDYVLSGDRNIYLPEQMCRVKERIRNVRSDELQKLLRRWMACAEKSMLVAYRKNASDTAGLSAGEIRKAWNQGKGMVLDRLTFHSDTLQADTVRTPLCLSYKHVFTTDMIAKERVFSRIRVHELILKNGLRIVLRPVSEGDSELLFTAIGRGGTADLPPTASARFEGTAGYMELGGIEAVGRDTLSAYLNQKGIKLNVDIGNYWHQMMGAAPVEHASEFFNLIYEKIYRPELCYADFEEITKEEQEHSGQETLLEKMLRRDPARMSAARLDSLVGNVPSRALPACGRNALRTPALDEIASYYRSLFGNPRGLTMVLTGRYDVEKIKPLVVSVFSRMGLEPQHCSLRHVRVRLPAHKYVEAFPNGTDSQTIMQYVFPHRYVPSLETHLTLKLMRDVLQAGLLRILREEANIAYSPYVSLFYNGIPQHVCYLDLSVAVKSANTLRAEKLIMQEIHRLQNETVTDKELAMMKHSFLVTKKQVLSEEAAVEWRNTLVGQIQNGESLSDFEHYKRCLDRITPHKLRKAFCRFLHPDRFILLYQGEHQAYGQ